MIEIILLCLSFIWPFGQALLITPPESPIRIHVIDAVIIANLFFLLLRKDFYNTFLKDKISLGLLIFFVSVLLSLLNAFPFADGKTIITATAYALRFFAYWGVYYSIRLYKYRPLHLNLAAFLFIISSLYQYFFMPDLRFLKGVGFDDHYYRLTSFIFDPNFAGLIISVIFFYSLSQGRVAVAYLQGVFLLTALALTFSRSSYLTLTAGLLTLVAITRRWRYVFTLILLSLIVFLVPKPFGEGVNLFRVFSIFSRLDSFQKGLDLFFTQPIFGVGFNTLKQMSGGIPQLSSGIDNSFIFILATTGILGFASFLFLLYLSFTNVKDLIGRLCLLLILFHSLFNNSFFQSSVLLVWIVIVAFPREKKLDEEISQIDSQLYQ